MKSCGPDPVAYDGSTAFNIHVAIFAKDSMITCKIDLTVHSSSRKH